MINQAPEKKLTVQLRGFILLGVIFFGIFLIQDNGFFAILLEGDRSRLSYLILFVWLIATLRWLWLLSWCQNVQISDKAADQDATEATMMRFLNHGWLAADLCLKIGLLGTIVGFIFMLAPIRDLAAFDPANLQIALRAMSGGMAVALYTTLAGLVCHMVLRLQYQMVADEMHKVLIGSEG